MKGMKYQNKLSVHTLIGLPILLLSSVLTWIASEVMLTPEGSIFETLLERSFISVSALSILATILFLFKQRKARKILSWNLHIILALLILLFLRNPDVSGESLVVLLFPTIPIIFCIITLHNQKFINLLNTEMNLRKLETKDD